MLWKSGPREVTAVHVVTLQIQAEMGWPRGRHSPGRSLGLRWGSRPGGITEGLACSESDVIGSKAPDPGGPGPTHLCVFRWLWGSAPHPPGLLSSPTPLGSPSRGSPILHLQEPCLSASGGGADVQSSGLRSACGPREEALTSGLRLARGPSYAW